MQVRATRTLQIAQECVDRKLYSQARVYLDQLQGQGELAKYVAASDQAKVADLASGVTVAVEERTRISKALLQSDQLLGEGQISLARQLLATIKDNKYLSEIESQQIVASIADLDKQIKAAPEKAAAKPAVAAEPKPAKPVIAQPKAAETAVEATQPVAEVAVQAAPEKAEAVANKAAVKAETSIAEVTVPVAPAKPAANEVVVIKTGPVAPVETKADAKAPVAVSEQTPQAEVEVAPGESDKASEDSYVRVVTQRRNRLRSYTQVIVEESIVKSTALLQKKEFEDAKDALSRAFYTVDENKLLLGDDIYKGYMGRLTYLRDEIISTQKVDTAAREQKAVTEAEKLTEKIRQDMEQQRIQAVADFKDRSLAFLDQQRYEEALGQLEQLLAIDSTNNFALILKDHIENTIGWRKELELEREKDKRELEILRLAKEKEIPYSSEINYPKNWKQLTARRKDEGFLTRDPADAAIYKQLEEKVNLSSLTEDTTFAEAMDVVRNAVEPPLPLVIMWNDLSENAFIEKDRRIGMPGAGLSNVKLLTGLQRVIEAVGGAGDLAMVAYIVDKGLVTVATKDYLPTEYKPIVYDVAELLSAPAMGMGGMMGGGMGGGMGGMMGGMGGGMGMMGGMGGGMGGFGGGGLGGGSSRGLGGGSSRGTGGGSRGGRGGGGGLGGGGGFGGGGMGGMMGGMGGMMGGMGGGMMGGGMMGGGMMGGMGGGMGGGMSYMQSMMRGYQIVEIIKATIRPETWYEEGGEGDIYPFGVDKLIVSQTPAVHEEIAAFLEQMVKGLGQQVALETRFLVVSESWLEEIGFDLTVNQLRLGGRWSPLSFEVGTAELATATGTNLTSGLPTSPALGFDLTYGLPLDDLQVSLMIKATQTHKNSSMLTAPKVMVMSGEEAMISFNTDKVYKSDSELTTDSITFQGVDHSVSYWEHTLDTLTTGINMNVTPTITADKKYVLLNISTYHNDLIQMVEEQSMALSHQGDLVQDSYELPITENTIITTRVQVPDQGTVMLGGLTLAAEDQVEAGVPVLAKIPVLGRLFSNRSEAKDKQVLLILVKPTIILKDEVEADAVAAMED